jgi:large subunit ribosomal protein L9
MVEVILRQDVEGVGKASSLIKVKEGFARNFLLPRGLAFIATPNNLKRIEEEKRQKSVLAEKEKKAAEELAQKLNGFSCTVVVDVNEKEKPYGSVSSADVERSLQDEGFDVKKISIMLDHPIEELGIYDVEIKLHPEVRTKIRLWVTKR